MSNKDPLELYLLPLVNPFKKVYRQGMYRSCTLELEGLLKLPVLTPYYGVGYVPSS